MGVGRQPREANQAVNGSGSSALAPSSGFVLSPRIGSSCLTLPFFFHQFWS
jgi:hypothetical protein